MATEATMPRLSDSMEEGTVLRWLKAVGDEVKRGDELVEIETDKANMTYEATDEGTLVEILAGEGDTLPIGEPIARIGDPSEPGSDGAGRKQRQRKGEAAEPEPEREPQPEPQAAPRAPTTTERPAPAPSGNGRVKASPVARRMARDLNVELGSIRGSGPGGRIVKADVEAAAGGSAPAPAAPAERPAERPAPERAPEPATAKGEAQVVELTRLQQTVARRMAESKATVPHFYLSMEIDMTEAVALRARLKEV